MSYRDVGEAEASVRIHEVTPGVYCHLRTGTCRSQALTCLESQEELWDYFILVKVCGSIRWNRSTDSTSRMKTTRPVVDLPLCL